MNENDMNNLLNQFNNMVKNNEIPDNLKDIINSFSNYNNNKNSNNSNNSSSNIDAETSSSTDFDIDINTIMKFKQIMEAMNSNKSDPRSNLLLSLKPYLKDSRKQKVDQYIKIFNIEKAFETFNSLGGDNKNDV